MELAELRNQFLDFLQQRCCGTRQEKMGLEYETFVALASDEGKWKSLPISGDVSIGKLLLKMAQLSSQGTQPWELHYEGELLLVCCIPVVRTYRLNLVVRLNYRTLPERI